MCLCAAAMGQHMVLARASAVHSSRLPLGLAARRDRAIFVLRVLIGRRDDETTVYAASLTTNRQLLYLSALSMHADGIGDRAGSSLALAALRWLRWAEQLSSPPNANNKG